MAIEIRLSDDVQNQSTEAGYASVEDYLQSLLRRDRNRLDCMKGLRDVASGRTRPFEQFDTDFRMRNRIHIEG